MLQWLHNVLPWTFFEVYSCLSSLLHEKKSAMFEQPRSAEFGGSSSSYQVQEVKLSEVAPLGPRWSSHCTVAVCFFLRGVSVNLRMELVEESSSQDSQERLKDTEAWFAKNFCLINFFSGGFGVIPSGAFVPPASMFFAQEESFPACCCSSFSATRHGLSPSKRAGHKLTALQAAHVRRHRLVPDPFSREHWSCRSSVQDCHDFFRDPGCTVQLVTVPFRFWTSPSPANVGIDAPAIYHLQFFGRSQSATLVQHGISCQDWDQFRLLSDQWCGVLLASGCLQQRNSFP